MKTSPITFLLVGAVTLLPVVGAQTERLPKRALNTLVTVAELLHSEAAILPSARSEQSQETTTSGPDESLLTLHASAREVHLVFTVTDKQNHYIKDLKQNDFKIMDDHKPPKEILSFQSETDLPLQVGLLIDTSQSVHPRFKFEQEAASQFLTQTLRRKYDQAFVIGFAIKPEVTQDFTDDPEKLSSGIQALRPGSLTAIYDAIYYACREKLLKHPQGGPVRRAIILLSDGNDNASSVTREKAIQMAQQAEVAVYTISTDLNRSRGQNQKNLESLADATGGRSFVPRQISEVADAFAAIQEELRSQYAVSYKPENFQLNGHYRPIDVQATNHKGLRIRSRKGYRASAGM